MSIQNNSCFANLDKNQCNQNDKSKFNKLNDQRPTKTLSYGEVKDLTKTKGAINNLFVSQGTIPHSTEKERISNYSKPSQIERRNNLSTTAILPARTNSPLHKGMDAPDFFSSKQPLNSSLKPQIKSLHPRPKAHSTQLTLLINSLEKSIKTKNDSGMDRILRDINGLYWLASSQQKSKVIDLISKLKVSPLTHFTLLNSILFTCKRWEVNLDILQNVLSCLIKAQQKNESLSKIVEKEHEFLTLPLWLDIFKHHCHLGRFNPTAAKRELQRLVNTYWNSTIKSEHCFLQFHQLCKDYSIPFEHVNPFSLKIELQDSIIPNYSHNPQIGKFVLELEDAEKEASPELNLYMARLEKEISENTIGQRALECLYDANRLRRYASANQVERFKKIISSIKIDSNLSCAHLKVIVDCCHFWQVESSTSFKLLYLLINSQKTVDDLSKTLERHQKSMTLTFWHLAFQKIQEIVGQNKVISKVNPEIQLLLDQCWLKSIHSKEDFYQLQALCNHYGYTFVHQNPFCDTGPKSKTPNQSPSITYEIYNFETFGEIFKFFKLNKGNLTNPNWCCLFDKLAELMYKKSLTLSQGNHILAILEFFTKSNAEIDGNLVGKLLRLYGKFSKKKEKLENRESLILNHLDYYLMDLTFEYLPELDSRAIYGVARGLRSIKNSQEINNLLKKLTQSALKRQDVSSQAYGGLIHALGCHAHRALYPMVSSMNFKEFNNKGLIETLHGIAEHAQKTNSTHREYGHTALELLLNELRYRPLNSEELALSFIFLAKCSYLDNDLIEAVEQLLDDDDLMPFLRLQIHFAFTTLGVTNQHIRQSTARLIDDAMLLFSDKPANPLSPQKEASEKPTYATLAMQQVNKDKESCITLDTHDSIPEDTLINYTNSITNNISLAFIAAFQLKGDHEDNLYDEKKVHFIIQKIFSDKRLAMVDPRLLNMLRQAATLTHFPKEDIPKEVLELSQSPTVISLTQNSVAEQLKERLSHPMIKIIEEANISYSPVDIFIEGATINKKPIVVEVDGPCHRTVNTKENLGKTKMKYRSLVLAGYHVETYNTNSFDSDDIERFVQNLMTKID